jgi:hypothetical protein
MSITCAIMLGDIVDNVIVVKDIEQSATDLGVELIEYTEDNPAGIGFTYDRVTNKFIPPVGQRKKEQ